MFYVLCSFVIDKLKTRHQVDLIPLPKKKIHNLDMSNIFLFTVRTMVQTVTIKIIEEYAHKSGDKMMYFLYKNKKVYRNMNILIIFFIITQM